VRLNNDDVSGLRVVRVAPCARVQQGNELCAHRAKPTHSLKAATISSRSSRSAIVIADDQLQKTIQAIVAAARTGKVGDGKVFVVKIEEAIRIRTQERGSAAV
jgi:nitrogen regulatory protein PII